MTYRVVFAKQAVKDARKLNGTPLSEKAKTILTILEHDPFQSPPPFEKLLGELTGAYSRRISLQHRLVYQVLPKIRVVKVLRMWTHYE